MKYFDQYSFSSFLLCIKESTIPNAGVGVFTAVPKENGDTIGNGDVVFPLLELPWYNGVEQLGLEYYEDYYDPFEDYVWDGITMGMGMESDAGFDAVTALWPGLDCAINCLIPLENVHRSFPQHNSHGDDLPYMPHRARDPGAGAVTTYRSAIQTVVKRDVPAGGELFKVSTVHILHGQLSGMKVISNCVFRFYFLNHRIQYTGIWRRLVY